MPTYEYEGPVEITELPITVKALATRTGYLDSAIATANYTQAKVATPAFTPVAGSYPYPVTVTITCATSGAQIKYSVDGSEPSLNYTVPLTVSSNTPVKAKAVKTNWLDSDVASVIYEQAQVPVVTFTPGSSAVVFPQTVYLATVLSGTTIYYTVGTNPPDPTTSDILYNPDNGVVLVAAGIIKAFAIKSGYIDSDVNSATYSQVQVATPAISQSYSPGGGYWYPNTITLTCATSGSTIRYTVDGSTPTSGSTLYTTPFAITSSMTVKARAFKSGYADSDVATRLYDQQRVTATPTISQSNAESGVPSPTSPLYPTVVTITGESGSTFYYTVDGSTPTNGSTLYSAPFNNTGQTPVKAIAYKTDYLPSAVATQAYTQRVVVTPTFSHPGGEIVLGSTVSISTTTPNCTIYYTVDGSTPDNTDTVYTTPVTIGSAMTLKAIAYKTGGFQPGSWAVSAVATASYTGPLSPVPVISPNGSGEYELPVKVLITTASAVDSIYYTVDGSTPDNTDTLYTGAFTVSTHGIVVKAISYKAGYTESAVATVTINQATYNYTASLNPAPNTPIVDGSTVTSTLKWKRAADGTLSAAPCGSVNINDYLTSMKALRNGKYMVSGIFGYDYGGSPGYTIKGLVRLNQDLTPDVNWRSTTTDFAGNGGSVSDFVELSDGSIVAVGGFTSINGATRNRICKFNPDGTLSNTFTTSLNGTNCVKIAVNKDDKILIVGDFTTVTATGGGTISQPNIAILNSDGTIAVSVATGATATYGFIESVCALADGNFLLAGQIYHPYQGYGVLKLAVATGGWNNGWTAPMQNYSNWGGRKIYVVKPLRDGRAVIAGTFNSIDFASTPLSSKQRIAILTSTGLVDNTFVAPDLSTSTLTPLNDGGGFIYDLEQMRSGNLFIAGYFRSVGMTSNSASSPYNNHHSMSMITLTGSLVANSVTGPSGGYGFSTIVHARRLMLTMNDEPIIFVADPTTQRPLLSATFSGIGATPASLSFSGIGKFKFNTGAFPATLCLCTGVDLGSMGGSKFTVNGSDPTLASGYLSNTTGITLNQTGGVFPTLKLRAAKPLFAGSANTASGFKLGELVESTYTWAQVATPTATPTGSGVAFGSTVALACATSGASIYYTVDGSTPDNTDTLYTGPVTINAALTLKAIAYKTNYLPSAVMSEAYTQLTVTTPVANPAGSAVKLGTPVTITCATSGSTIRYTVDGSDPGLVNRIPVMTSNAVANGWGAAKSSELATFEAFNAFDANTGTSWLADTGQLVPQWIAAVRDPLLGAETMTAYAVTADTYVGSPKDFKLQGSTNGSSWTDLDTRTGVTWSGTERKQYSITSPAAYMYYRLYISAVQDNAYEPAVIRLELLRYGALYSTALRIDEAGAIKAIGLKAGCIDSAVMTETYTQAQVATPVATPAGGAVPFSGTSVSLACSSPAGAQINYTIDGSEPLPRGPVARWPMNGNATDVIGGSNGTLIGASFVSGGIAGGQCLSCSGGVSYMNMISSAAQAQFQMANKDFSVVIWVNTTSTAQNSIIFSKHTAGSTNGYMIGMNLNVTYGAANKAWFYVSNTPGGEAISTTSVNDGNWHQIVGVYGANGYLRIYVDGGAYEAIKTSVSSPIDNGSQLQVPGVASNGSGTFVGKFNDLQIYDRALTPAEIATLYANPGTTVGDTETLRYSSPLTISSAQTIKAIALKADYLDSDEMSEAYTQAQLAAVTFDPVDGTSGASLITLSQATSGSTIRYTIDGSTPTISNGFTYSGPFVIVAPKTVKAYAYKTGYIDSNVSTATYP